ncbi:hypothetical protein [Delftia acidovorans]|uniref:hypothetical protein n=1 Tax=Delftia acidovorans TaxID=80866 RepID=UPI00078813B9|nr:hypothetical protein [Delftia acidovorans]QQB48423.1 hypothetical protein I6H54_18775 [Delftia acidovorans]
MNHSNSLAHLGSGPTVLQRAAESVARGAAYESAQIAPAPQSQVEAALSNIDAGMEDLQNTIRRISGRLEPVLSAAGVSAEGSAHEAEPASPTPLVRRLNELATQLRKDRAALQDLERRLAL